MDKTKEEFVHFIRHAILNRSSNEYIELYDFLLTSFIRADDNLDGMVTLDEFDGLMEAAAAIPRKYGFAPQAKDMYPTDAVRKEARVKDFAKMDSNNDGHISFDEWLAFSLKHIAGKLTTLPKDMLGADASKEEFIAFTKKSVDKSSSEYRVLFCFLVKCFTDADTDKDGAVQPGEFDTMIDIAAAAPRRHGLAPSAATLFKHEAERLEKRTEYFKKMDSNNDGNISLDEWIKFAMDHIISKVATLK